MRNIDHILGTLYGQAIGDAFGMPSELWPIEQIHAYFKHPITEFLDGPSSNNVACNFTKGEYTDDTNQALAIIDALIETDWHPDQACLVDHIMQWANEVDAWHNNILGPSSKAALLAIRHHEDPTDVTKKALTNGAGMRIAPIGTLFTPADCDALVTMVCEITKMTHSSDVAYSGATAIAAAVTAGIADYSWEDLITFALNTSDQARQLGAPTWAAQVRARTELGVRLAHQYTNDAAAFSHAIYTLIGTGTMISESIPAALAIAYYTQDVKKCAVTCANLGGDTDTIGAMATAICGAKNGIASIDPTWIRLIDEKNPTHDLKKYGQHLLTATL